MVHSVDKNSQQNLNVSGIASQLIKPSINSNYDSEGVSQQNFFHANRKLQKTEQSPY
jgi:hypothetical protein